MASQLPEPELPQRPLRIFSLCSGLVSEACLRNVIIACVPSYQTRHESSGLLQSLSGIVSLELQNYASRVAQLAGTFSQQHEHQLLLGHLRLESPDPQHVSRMGKPWSSF